MGKEGVCGRGEGGVGSKIMRGSLYKKMSLPAERVLVLVAIEEP